MLDDNTMVCSCNRHRRHLMTCGHIMLIVGISHPVVCHVRWWNSFQLHCARDKKLTEHFNKMLMNTNDAVSVKGLNIALQHGVWLCCFALFYNICWHCNCHCNYQFYCFCNFDCNCHFFGTHHFCCVICICCNIFQMEIVFHIVINEQTTRSLKT